MSADNRPTETDIDWPHELSMIRYFWEEKGDVERYVDWQKLQPQLRIMYPEIVAAWESYKTTQRMLSAILKGLS